MGRRPRQLHINLPPEPPASAIITLKDIAEHCGLSRWAVSAALRDKPGIAESTREQVKAVALALGYNPALNSSARRLTMRKHGIAVRNHLIALFADRQFYEHHSYWTGIFRGLMDELTSQRYSLLHVYGWEANSLDAEMPIPHGIERGEVDGAVLFGPNCQVTVEHLRRCPGFTERPILTLITPSPRCATVGVDYHHGAYDVMRHLLELGHRHFLFLAPSWTELVPLNAPTNRLPGIFRALSEAGLSPASHLHYLHVAYPWMINPPSMDDTEDDFPMVEPAAAQDETGHNLITYLEAHREITAIIALSDQCAYAAYNALRLANIAVPERISLVGFDDTLPLRDVNGRNLLTTVRIPRVAIGRTAATLMLDLLDETATTDTRLLLPPKLVIRHTTGPVGG